MISAFSLVYTGYTLWSHSFDNNCEDELVDKASNEIYTDYVRKQGDNYITVLHTTEYYKNSDLKFSDGKPILLEDWLLGHYIVEFSDGTTEKLPVVYGQNIANCELKKKTMEYNRLVYMCLPVEMNGKTYFETIYKVNSEASVVGYKYAPVNEEANI